MRLLKVCLGVMCLFAGVSSGEESAQAAPRPSKTYFEYRNIAFEFRHQDLGIAAEPGFERTWCVIVESLGEDGLPITMVALEDGTCSVYYGLGGAHLNGGSNPSLAGLAKDLVKTANSDIKRFPAAESWEPPSQRGAVVFYIRTTVGTRRIAAQEASLSAGIDANSHLYQASARLLSQLQPADNTARRKP